MEAAIGNGTLGRRKFIKRAGLVGAALPILASGVAAACADSSAPAAGRTTTSGSPTVTTPAGGGGHGGVTAQVDWQKMDNDHKKGVEDFLKNQTTPLTKGKGMVELKPKLEGDVKVFDLTMDEVDWEVSPGVILKGRGYNNMIPGPTIRVTEGDKIKVNVKNNLTESSAVHWHGIRLPNAMDGVPYVTQNPIQPGKTFTYEFQLRNQGSHMYHSHHNSSDQVNRGLLGAFIVEPKDKSTYPKYDKEAILIMNDVALGFTLNGKSFPATDALVAKKGEKLLVRWMNEGMLYHPMHLHGLSMTVFQRDGYPVNPPYECDTIDVPPGNRFDCIIDCNEVGLWGFHCHVLSHAESPAGFFGLVTVLVIQE